MTRSLNIHFLSIWKFSTTSGYGRKKHWTHRHIHTPIDRAPRDRRASRARFLRAGGLLLLQRPVQSSGALARGHHVLSRSSSASCMRVCGSWNVVLCRRHFFTVLRWSFNIVSNWWWFCVDVSHVRNILDCARQIYFHLRSKVTSRLFYFECERSLVWLWTEARV